MTYKRAVALLVLYGMIGQAIAFTKPDQRKQAVGQGH